MAKFELKFYDWLNNHQTIEVKEMDGIISIFVEDKDQKNTNGICIHLDKSTSIKFAKTLRTEINKITEEEVNNGNR
jgi:lactam utilization protein B